MPTVVTLCIGDLERSMEAAQSLLAMRPYKQLNLYSIYTCF